MKILKHIANEQENIATIVLTTIFLSVGLEFIINSLLTLVGVEKQYYFYLLLGISIVGIILVIIYVRAVKKIKKCIKLDGFMFVIDREIVAIPNYDFSNNMNRYLKAAFLENNALKKIWDKNKFYDILEFDATKKICTYNLNDAYKLFIEAFQYTILEKLSIHLTDYFDQTEINSEKIDTKYRKDISELVVNNRFLNLFSEEIKNRELFSENNYDDAICVLEENGIFYNKFDLTLPKNSKIILVDYKTIEIQLPKLIVRIIFIFEGVNTIIPDNFIDYYLAKDSQAESNVPFHISLEFEIEIKKSGMLTYLSNEYYTWIDDFISDMDIYFSKDTFFERINWNSVETLLQVRKNLDKNK